MTYYNGIIDTHAHYDDERFAEKLDEILAVQKEHGIEAIIENSSDLPSSRNTIALAEKYDFIYGAVGVHPEEAGNLPEDWLKTVEEMTKRKKIVAIGEIGLDYHYSPETREKQIELFAAQLELAKERNLPVVIHTREADEDTFALLREIPSRGVIHCYTGTPEAAKKFLDLGFYISISGIVTFKSAENVRASALVVPDDRILIETDAPFLAPVPMRGNPNEPAFVKYTCEFLAALRGSSAEEFAELTFRNGERMLGMI